MLQEMSCSLLKLIFPDKKYRLDLRPEYVDKNNTLLLRFLRPAPDDNDNMQYNYKVVLQCSVLICRAQSTNHDRDRKIGSNRHAVSESFAKRSSQRYTRSMFTRHDRQAWISRPCTQPFCLFLLILCCHGAPKLARPACMYGTFFTVNLFSENFPRVN